MVVRLPEKATVVGTCAREEALMVNVANKAARAQAPASVILFVMILDLLWFV
jgi:hypothetical protein